MPIPSTQQGEVARHDYASLRPAARGPGGSLLVELIGVRPCVMQYRDADGNSWTELIDEEQLRDADSLATLGRAPMTLMHPVDDNGRAVDVTAENADRYVVGDVDGDVEVVNGGFVRLKGAIRRADAIEAAVSGDAADVSLGYRCQIDPTPGVWVDPATGIQHRYDARQLARRYNHVALVDRGRCPGAYLRADAAPAAASLPTPGASMNPKIIAALLALLPAAIRSDMEEAEPEKLVDALGEQMGKANEERDEAQQKAADAEAALEQEKADHAAALEQARVDAEKAKTSALSEQKAALAEQAKADRAAYFDERTRLLGIAERVKVDGAADLADLPELRRAIVKAVKPDFAKLDSDSHVEAALELLAGAPRQDADPFAGLGRAIGQRRNDGAPASPPAPVSIEDAQRADHDSHFQAARAADRS